MFKKYDLTGDTYQFFNITRDPELLEYKNPGVPIILVTSRGLKTYQKMEYDADLWDYKKKDTFFYPKITVGKGDETVTTNSSLIIGFKWAWEFDNKVENAKPVKFVDFCSTFNEKYNPYDLIEGSKEYKLEKNEFFGI